MGNVEEGDSRVLKGLHRRARLVQSLLDGPGAHRAVIEQRFERIGRHRVDGVRADDGLHVHQVEIRRVLRRRARPKRALNPPARGANARERFTLEEFLKFLIRHFEVRDAGLSKQGRQRRFTLVDLCLNQLIDRRVDATYEYRVDGADAIDRLTFGDSPFEAAHVRARRLLVHFHGEDQGDIDVNAGVDCLFDGGDALIRPGDLHHQIWPVHAGPQFLGHRDRSGGVVRQQRGNFEADKSVVAARRIVDAAERVACIPNIPHGKLPEQGLRGRVVLDEVAELVVVIVSRADGFFEDRRIARHSAQPLVDESLQFAGGKHAAAQIVQPYALAGVEQFLQLVFHEFS